MKKIALALGLIGFCSFDAFSADVWQSSTTATASLVLTPLCAGTTMQYKRAILHGVCTDFAVASASMTIYNSTWTVAVGKIINPGLSVEKCAYYDTDFPSGMSIRKNNTAGATILYKCY